MSDYSKKNKEKLLQDVNLSSVSVICRLLDQFQDLW